MLSFFLSGQPGTLLGLWWGYYRSCDPCTGASIPCFLFYLCNMQTANWRTSICSGRSWRSVLPWGLLQVNMRFRWELKIIKRILTCLLASKWPIKEVCSKMQCLQPINHSKRRRYWQLHCRMPGALVPWELLQMRGRKMSKWCHVKKHLTTQMHAKPLFIVFPAGLCHPALSWTKWTWLLSFGREDALQGLSSEPNFWPALIKNKTKKKKNQTNIFFSLSDTNGSHFNHILSFSSMLFFFRFILHSITIQNAPYTIFMNKSITFSLHISTSINTTTHFTVAKRCFL